MHHRFTEGKSKLINNSWLFETFDRNIRDERNIFLATNNKSRFQE